MFAVIGLVMTLISVTLLGLTSLAFESITMSVLIGLILILIAIPFLSAMLAGFTGTGILVAGGLVFVMSILLNVIFNFTGILTFVSVFLSYLIAALAAGAIGFR